MLVDPPIVWMQVCGHNQHNRWVCTPITHATYMNVGPENETDFNGWWFKGWVNLWGRKTRTQRYAVKGTCWVPPSQEPAADGTPVNVWPCFLD